MTTQWSPEQIANANTIIQVGNQLGASQRDITIALMTAMQESGLKNINYGDAAGPDSLGLFQQRAPWGPASERMDPAGAARMFFEGGHTGEPGLFSFSNRNNMSLTQAAQAVQVSAFPNAYAKWQSDAESILGAPAGSQTGAAAQGPRVTSQLSQVSGSALSHAGLNSVNDQVISAPAGTQDAVLGQSILGAPNPKTDQLNASNPADQAIKAETNSISSQNQTVQQGEQSVAQGEKSVLDAGTTTGQAVASPTAMQEAGTQGFLQPLSLTQFTQKMGGSPLPQSTVGLTGLASGVTGARSDIISKAMAQVGTPYVWGGTQPGGFDCSGLVQWAYAQAGINLPRISYAQAQAGPRVAINQLQPGDLVAFDDYNRNGNGLADHISIYLGNNQILEAPHTGANVRVRTLGPADEANAWGVNMQSYFGNSGGASSGSQQAQSGSGDGIL